MGIPPPIEIANVSMGDTLLLMVLALVVLGPRRLPELGRQIGKLMYEFRKASNDFKFQMEEELRQAEEADRRKKEEAERQRVLAAAPPPPQIAPPAESPIQSPEPTAPPEPPAEIAADVPAPAVTNASDSVSGSESVTESPQTPPTPLSSSEPAPAASPEPVSPGPTNPRIAPPSTGEKVAADRPGARGAQQELFTDEAGKTPDDVGQDAGRPETERSEPAAHHG
jgi:sec-independent protein translocase protein TatB